MQHKVLCTANKIKIKKHHFTHPIPPSPTHTHTHTIRIRKNLAYKQRGSLQSHVLRNPLTNGDVVGVIITSEVSTLSLFYS